MRVKAFTYFPERLDYLFVAHFPDITSKKNDLTCMAKDEKRLQRVGREFEREFAVHGF
jgi:hypothetical protein